MSLGCDISKAWIDVARPDGVQAVRVANSGAALRRWIAKLAPGTVVGMEATGTLHELLAHLLCEAGHTVFVINPRWIHRYAGAVGQRGKTDMTDAQLIARFVQAEHRHLHPYRPPTPKEALLRKLLLRRAQVAKLKAATRQSLGSSAASLLVEFSRAARTLDRQIAELLSSCPHWASTARRLQTIPGVGPLVAAYLVQVLSRFPFRTADAFVAHTGTDPRPNDSGRKRGRRRLTHHGDSALRALLFLAAMAARRSAPWRAIYETQRAKGLASTAALIVLARKIARIAFSIYKSGRPYEKDLVSAPSGT